MPDGVSGDWETMISRAYMFLTIGRQLAKAATTAADHVPDGTPEERSQIAQHVAAIYRILRDATVRRGGIGEFPMLGPGHRSPLYRSSHLAARFALGLATGQEWSHFYYLNGGSEIARVEVPDWLADDPELLALSHAMLVKQCQLGLGYPVAISEAHEQAVITGHDREEFRRLTLMLLEQQGLPTPESAKATSKRRPWVDFTHFKRRKRERLQLNGTG